METTRLHFYRSVAVLLCLAVSGCSSEGGREARDQVQKPAEPARGEQTPACDFSSFKPVRESHFFKRAFLSSKVPLYPEEAVQERIQGRVPVQILIDRTGRVTRACATEGHTLLKKAAEDASLQWRFKPNFGLPGPQYTGSREYMTDVIVYEFLLGDSPVGTIPADGATIVVRAD